VFRFASGVGWVTCTCCSSHSCVIRFVNIQHFPQMVVLRSKCRSDRVFNKIWLLRKLVLMLQDAEVWNVALLPSNCYNPKLTVSYAIISNSVYNTLHVDIVLYSK
jgi:hypothetical protein